MIDPRYLQVPDTLPARVRDLGEQLVGGATTRLAAVQAVGTRLRQSMSYTLDAPVPPSGADAVDFALFESHQGFCEHYASAAVMLLRSGGIPARMVVGYLAEGKESIGDDRQLIRQAQAHAWAEVWFPGAGWVTFESTPAGGLDESFLDDLNSAFNRAMNDLAERFSAFVAGVVGPVVLGVVLLVIWLFRRFLLRQLARLVARVTGRRKLWTLTRLTIPTYEKRSWSWSRSSPPRGRRGRPTRRCSHYGTGCWVLATTPHRNRNTRWKALSTSSIGLCTLAHRPIGTNACKPQPLSNRRRSACGKRPRMVSPWSVWGSRRS